MAGVLVDVVDVGPVASADSTSMVELAEERVTGGFGNCDPVRLLSHHLVQLTIAFQPRRLMNRPSRRRAANAG